MTRICGACHREVTGRFVAKYGWCGACHMRWHRAGRPEGGPPSPNPRFTARLDALTALTNSGYGGDIRFAARFWSKVDQRDSAECWPWTGALNENGYGVMRPEGKRSGPTIKAHRVSMLLDGHDPGELHVLHRCDNPPCVNPAHLFFGTPATNSDDKIGRGRGAKGERIAQAKLCETQVVEIRALMADGAKRKDVAELFAVSGATITRIVQREGWRHVPEAVTGEDLDRSL